MTPEQRARLKELRELKAKQIEHVAEVLVEPDPVKAKAIAKKKVVAPVAPADTIGPEPNVEFHDEQGDIIQPAIEGYNPINQQLQKQGILSDLPLYAGAAGAGVGAIRGAQGIKKLAESVLPRKILNKHANKFAVGNVIGGLGGGILGGKLGHEAGKLAKEYVESKKEGD